MTQSYKDESRINWIRNAETPRGANEIIKIGCLQRIADATELMARRYSELMARRYSDLIAERDNYRRLYEEEAERRRFSDRSRAALRGVIARMKAREGA